MDLSKKIAYRVFAWTLPLAYMGLIFWLSSKPSVPVPVWFAHQDKLFHFLEFNVLAFLLAHAVSSGSHKRRFWIAFGLTALYALSDEVHQNFVPGRDCSVWDWLADTIGGWMGAYLYLKSESVLLRRAKR
jgi:VanZ family protein